MNLSVLFLWRVLVNTDLKVLPGEEPLAFFFPWLQGVSFFLSLLRPARVNWQLLNMEPQEYSSLCLQMSCSFSPVYLMAMEETLY